MEIEGDGNSSCSKGDKGQLCMSGDVVYANDVWRRNERRVKRAEEGKEFVEDGG